MADLFDASLFDEFKRDEAPSERVMMSKVNKELASKDNKTRLATAGENNGKQDDVNGKDKGDVGDNTSSAGESEMETDQNSSKIAALEAELQQLRKENLKLRNLVGTDSRMQIDEAPQLEIVYMNQPFARRNCHEIECFLKNVMEEDRKNSNRKLPTTSGRANIVCLAGSSKQQTPSPMEKLRQMETGMVMGCSHYYQDFIIDIMGTPLVDYDPSKTDGWYVPYYLQDFREPLPLDEDEDDTKPKKKEKPKRTCFNCGGDHNLNECQERRNPQKIREAMNAFKSSKNNQSNASLKNSRYHEDDCEPRFAHFKPGVWSDELRVALGAKKGQLPPYIYMMRKMGYPPGWLEHVKQETSGLAIFDGAGKEIAEDGEAVEEGEVSDVTEAQPKYKIDKLIDYPGFNVPVPEGVTDEYERLRCLPIQPQHSKHILAEFLTPADGPPKGRKRKGGDVNVDPQNKSMRMDEDMDLDASNQEEDNLEDLVERQRQLQMQLALADGSMDSTDVVIIDSVDDDDENSTPPVPPTPERPPLPLTTPPVTPINTPHPPPPGSTPVNPPLPDGTPPVTPAAANTSFKTPGSSVRGPGGTPQTVQELVQSTPQSGGSIEQLIGTPVLEQETPTMDKGLPELNKFSQGVSQHIPFENLPETTGNFQKLRQVLSKNKRESL